MSQTLTHISSQMLMSLPFFLAYALGMLLAVMHWQRSPRAAALTLVSATLLLGVRGGQIVWFAWVTMAPRNSGFAGTNYATIFSLINFGGGLVSAVALGCLFFAVFVDRRTPWDEEPPSRRRKEGDDSWHVEKRGAERTSPSP